MPDAITRCPGCQTSFRVTDSQLEIADGSVRCGACLNIFRAADHFLSPPLDVTEQARITGQYWDDFDEYQFQTMALVERADTSSLLPEPTEIDLDDEESISNSEPLISGHEEELFLPTESASYWLPIEIVPDELAVAKARFALSDEPKPLIGIWEPEATSTTATAPSLSTEALKPSSHDIDAGSVDVSDDTGARVVKHLVSFTEPVPEVSESDSDGADQQMPVADDGDPNADLLEYLAFHAPVPRLLVDDEKQVDKPQAGVPHVYVPNVDETQVDELSSGPEASESGEPDTPAVDSVDQNDQNDQNIESQEYVRATTDPPLTDMSFASDAAETEGDEFDFDLEEPVDLNDHRRTVPELGFKWIPGIALLLLLGAGQYAYFNIDQLGQRSEYRPWYEVGCRWLACELPTYRNYSELITKDLVIRSHPDDDQALLLDVLLMNSSDYRQAFPALRLSFLDIKGKVVASRDFEVNEYLGGELRGLKFIPAVTEVRLSLALQDPGEHALGYEMSVVRR